MAKKKGPRLFANIFCKNCKDKITTTEFNKKNHTLDDLINKIKAKFCRSCHCHQEVKIKELKQ